MYDKKSIVLALTSSHSSSSSGVESNQSNVIYQSNVMYDKKSIVLVLTSSHSSSSPGVESNQGNMIYDKKPIVLVLTSSFHLQELRATRAM